MTYAKSGREQFRVSLLGPAEVLARRRAIPPGARVPLLSPTGTAPRTSIGDSRSVAATPESTASSPRPFPARTPPRRSARQSTKIPERKARTVGDSPYQTLFAVIHAIASIPKTELSPETSGQ